ncbi:hypothetical protein [Rhodococcus aetherivorans]|uniref:hypothetical protein n=1 Tax=Rhodococcus aetherivorans TaxID=191292 RepID=UPI00163A978D|nr:hypothetical protein [Rhodococcus aetherivorans]MBC2586905.1 hypothetical protein [Rhodococcus aetherivorans]
MIELQQLSLNPQDTGPELYGHRIAISEGFTGVARVVNEIRMVDLHLTLFRAFPGVDYPWYVEFVCKGESDRMERLRKRLYRIPSVVRIHCWRVASLPL